MFSAASSPKDGRAAGAQPRQRAVVLAALLPFLCLSPLSARAATPATEFARPALVATAVTLVRVDATGTPKGEGGAGDGGSGKADGAAPSPKTADGKTADGNGAPQKAPMDKRTQLEGLFAALKAAPDDRSAKLIANRLDQIFNTTDSASIDLLLARAGLAIGAKDYDLALRLLDQALEIDPDDIGARAKRASVYYMRDDYGAALADIREVLAREPRHFNAMFGLALILRDLGEDKLALDAARKALAVNPRLEPAQDMVTQLKVSVEGREI